MENAAINNKAADAGLDAAAVQFEAIRSLLDTLDEDDALALVRDASAEFVGAFIRSMNRRLNEYIDARD